MLLVNPFTAWGLVERARAEGHRAVVQSAASSALGPHGVAPRQAL